MRKLSLPLHCSLGNFQSLREKNGFYVLFQIVTIFFTFFYATMGFTKGLAILQANGMLELCPAYLAIQYCQL